MVKKIKKTKKINRGDRIKKIRLANSRRKVIVDHDDYKAIMGMGGRWGLTPTGQVGWSQDGKKFGSPTLGAVVLSIAHDERHEWRIIELEIDGQWLPLVFYQGGCESILEEADCFESVIRACGISHRYRFRRVTTFKEVLESGAIKNQLRFPKLVDTIIDNWFDEDEPVGTGEFKICGIERRPAK